MKRAQKNVTFSLPPETIDQVREMASQYDCSMNTIVKDALDAWFQAEELASFKQAMHDASVDPLFQADMETVTDDFAGLDSEVSLACQPIGTTDVRHAGKTARKGTMSRKEIP